MFASSSFLVYTHKTLRVLKSNQLQIKLKYRSYNPPQQGAFEDPINAQQQQQQTQQALKDRRSICKKISDLDTKTVISYLRYANLCNAMCIITAGIVTVATLGSGSLNLTSMFIGLYIS